MDPKTRDLVRTVVADSFRMGVSRSGSESARSRRSQGVNRASGFRQ
jgi:hypothetical protein